MDDLKSSFENFTRSLRYENLKLIDTEYNDREGIPPVYIFEQNEDYEAGFEAADLYIARYDDYGRKWQWSKLSPRIESENNGEFQVDFYLYACDWLGCPNRKAFKIIHKLVKDKQRRWDDDFDIRIDDEDMAVYNVLYKGEVIASYEDDDYSFQLGDGNTEMYVLKNPENENEKSFLIVNEGDVESAILIRINRV